MDGAAHYLQEIIKGKLAAGIQDAIFFDCMACATMIAFAFEAYLNFFGAKLVDPWNERQRINDKIKQVYGALKLAPDWHARPFSGVRAMKDLRDIFAHGKPQTIEMDEEVEADYGELDGKRCDLGPEWEKLCTPATVLAAYGDLQAVWKAMLENSGMTMFETMDHGEGGTTYIGDVEPAGE
ncbi:hypothetical protein [Bradyrhizobium stylosanthis]|uniref:hypothetical protein n=1 Tax=Bradyrhizobium stylosanthis TaxID=1803665 RepID=UPI0011A689AE|nr:hypothetical protein [Bradyrhizobium stylosanthis]